MATPGDQQAAFTLERIYVKDISYEAPNTPQVFLEQEAPAVNVQLGIEHGVIDASEGYYEALLTVTVTANVNEKTVFLIEAKQAGLFRIAGVTDEDLGRLLEINCPTILLPYAREVLSSLIGKGGFPQLLLAPINFEALYEQKRATQSATRQ